MTAGRRELNIMPQWGYKDRALLDYQVSPRQTFAGLPAQADRSRTLPTGAGSASTSVDGSALRADRVLDGECRAITPKIERGLTSIGWSTDGARIFYLQRTDRPGWGELKSIGVDGSTPRTHGTFGALRPYETYIGVPPRDEIAFAPYREGPHELWMAQLR